MPELQKLVLQERQRMTLAIGTIEQNRLFFDRVHMNDVCANQQACSKMLIDMNEQVVS